MHERSVVPGLPALVFAALTGTMAMMAFVAVVGPVVRLLGLAEWHAGLSVTAAGVLWMLSARRWGSLSDRIGRKRVLLIALSAYVLIYVAMAIFVDAARELFIHVRHELVHLHLHLRDAPAHVEDDLDAGQIDAEFTGELEDDLQPFQVLFGVEAGVAVAAAGL